MTLNTGTGKLFVAIYATPPPNSDDNDEKVTKKVNDHILSLWTFFKTKLEVKNPEKHFTTVFIVFNIHNDNR